MGAVLEAGWIKDKLNSVVDGGGGGGGRCNANRANVVVHRFVAPHVCAYVRLSRANSPLAICPDPPRSANTSASGRAETIRIICHYNRLSPLLPSSCARCKVKNRFRRARFTRASLASFSLKRREGFCKVYIKNEIISLLFANIKLNCRNDNTKSCARASLNLTFHLLLNSLSSLSSSFVHFPTTSLSTNST